MKAFAAITLASSVSAMSLLHSEKAQDSFHMMITSAIKLLPAVAGKAEQEAINAGWTSYEMLGKEDPCGAYNEARSEAEKMSAVCWPDQWWNDKNFDNNKANECSKGITWPQW